MLCSETQSSDVLAQSKRGEAELITGFIEDHTVFLPHSELFQFISVSKW